MVSRVDTIIKSGVSTMMSTIEIYRQLIQAGHDISYAATVSLVGQERKKQDENTRA